VSALDDRLLPRFVAQHWLLSYDDVLEAGGNRDQIGPDRVRVGCGYLDVHRERHSLIGGTMTWVKPKFEIVDLCSEVTSYLHRR